MATCPKKSLIEEVTEKALSPQEVQVAGMGASKEQRLDHQLEFLKTMCATRAGRGAGILRTPIRVSSPTGLRFRYPLNLHE